MANLLVRNGSSEQKYLKTSGVGSDGDPHIPTHKVQQDSTAVTVTLTRPADTTAYAAGDAITDSTSSPNDIEFDFSGIAANGDMLEITKVVIADSGITSESLSLRLFDAAVTATNDNSAFSVSDSDNNNSVSLITLISKDRAGASTLYDSGAISEFVKLDAADDTLYGLLRTISAFTPISAETFQITIYARLAN
jgi:hypothetical protein